MSTESCDNCGTGVSEHRLCEECDGSLQLRRERDEARVQRDELLAALKWALPFAERFENTYPGGPRQRLMESKISEVRTAIAKAEGRS